MSETKTVIRNRNLDREAKYQDFGVIPRQAVDVNKLPKPDEFPELSDEDLARLYPEQVSARQARRAAITDAYIPHLKDRHKDWVSRNDDLSQAQANEIYAAVRAAVERSPELYRTADGAADLGRLSELLDAATNEFRASHGATRPQEVSDYLAERKQSRFGRKR